MSLPGARAQAQAVQRGEISPQELLEACLSRTDSLIGADSIGAFLRLDAHGARAQAERVAQRLSQGEHLPLAGVPVAIKDNLAQEGVALGCASLALRDWPAETTATAVRRLEAAGAVVVGRTNMDEMAMGSSTERSAFHSTLNPYDPDRVPGGSSGGSAAAVASGAVALALGSDTGGSIRQPAAFCGLAGLRPTWGRVSRHGLCTVAATMDTIGPMARSVGDLGLALQVLAGPDPLDPTAADRPVEEGWATCTAPIKGRSVGILMEGLGRGVQAAVKARVNEGLAALEQAGVRLRPVSAPSLAHAVSTYQLVAAAEAAQSLAWIAKRRERLGPEVQRRLLLGTWLRTEAEGRALLDRAWSARARIREELLALLDQVDVLACPTTPTVAFRLGEREADPTEMYLADQLTTPASLAGLPALSVPVGMADLGLGDRMPAGLQLIGRPWDEALLLAMGGAVEAGVPPIPPPPKPGLR